MSKACETMRVPGFSSLFSFGISFRFSDGSRYSVTTVASLMSVVNRSWLRNFTLSVTPAVFRVLVGLADAHRIDVDADAARAVGLRRGDRNAAVAGAEVVDDVVLGHLGQLEHRVDDFLRRRHEDDVRRAQRLLRQRT